MATGPRGRSSATSEQRRERSTAAKAGAAKTNVAARGHPPADGATLVVVESPTKARTISSILGPQYLVLASKGHLADLPKKGLGYDEATFDPEYEVPSRKAKDLAALREAAKRASRVIIATDPDREGEAIGWHVARLLRSKDPERMEFHEITPRAVREALANPRRIDDALVAAQEARRVLDRMVGYKASPALWRTVKPGLSAGRVQSVAMALLADREREINEFTVREYWSVHLSMRRQDDSRFPAELRLLDGAEVRLVEDKPPLLASEAAAVAALAHAQGRAWRVEKVDRKSVRKPPPPPFTTSTLQQAASSALHFTPRRTMQAAQSLYERGLITYMRTDSVAIAADAIETARKAIQAGWGRDFVPAEPRRYANKAGAQGAHECIRPTEPGREGIGVDLDEDARRLYRVIRARFLACQAADAIYDRRSAEMTAAGCTCVARAYSSRVTFSGWLDVAGLRGEDDEDEEAGQELPDLKVGEVLTAPDGSVERHETKPPARFTEASLVKALEERGVGRPSTYAPTIEVILEREYAVKEGRALKATPLAMTVTEWARERIPDLVDPAFTARVEEDLDRIAEHAVDHKEMLRRFADGFLPAVTRAVEAGRKRVEGPAPEPTGERCPECGGELVKRTSRFGEFVACGNYPQCKYKPPKAAPTPPEGVDAPACPQCDGPMVLRQAQRGRGHGTYFWGCANYPTCKGIVSADGKPAVETAIDPALAAQAAATVCPNCGKPMTVRIARKGPNAGKPFMGCTGYPRCKTVVAISDVQAKSA